MKANKNADGEGGGKEGGTISCRSHKTIVYVGIGYRCWIQETKKRNDGDKDNIDDE